MKVSLIQSDLVWENAGANLKHFSDLILTTVASSDLIILPEMFSTAFSMAPERVAENHPGEAFEWMCEMAKQKNAIISGSLSVKEHGFYYNRLYWVRPDGTYAQYDKRHLFRMANEDVHYSEGERKIIEKIKDVTVCPLICYDLRFPVWSRNRFTKSEGDKFGTWDYDVLVYVANWPEARTYQWKQLLIARAIENQCYVLGVNRVGTDGNGFTYAGESLIIGPKGEIIASLAAHREGILQADLDADSLEAFRQQFPVGMDADDFLVQ